MRKYLLEHKKSLLCLIIGLLVIIITSLCGSLTQSAGGTIAVTDLRNETNTGYITQEVYNEDTGETTTKEVKVSGKVVSGILFKPKSATADNPLPGVVLTHGYLNNRELQLPFAIELARRGFVVLTVDREGHGNYPNTDETGAMMATNGLYDSAKYLYNLDYVDKDKIGISGHSMGGYTTAMTLMQDNADNGGLGIISAGLMQGWSTFLGAGSDVDVGMLKASDDEFFFASTDSNGEPTLCRDYLHSTGAANFVGITYEKGSEINIGNGTYYVNGVATTTTLGTAIDEPFRVIYEADEIHPLNHWSIPSTAHLVDFFYTAFGTPNGFEVKGLYNQVWYIKEIFATIGLLAIFFLIFPLVSLILTIPAFKSLKTRKVKVELVEDKGYTYHDIEVTPELLDKEVSPLKTPLDWIFYFVPAIICTMFSGFIIHDFVTEWGGRWFPNTQLYPQDTTNWVALWSAACGIFALLIVLFFFIIKYGIHRYKYHDEQLNKDSVELQNPLATAKISGTNLLKTLVVAFGVVIILYLIVFLNWAIFKTDFRLWTFAIKVFNIPEMVPTAMRYLLFFAIFYLCAGIANQTYRAKNLPEWATIAINAFFNIFGIALVITIQYATFKSTGELWQGDMALGYIVLFPILPILIIATIISRLLYKKTGNVWLGSLINAILFTMITVSGTAASFAYVMG